MDLNAMPNLDSLVGLIGRTIPKLGKADDVDTDLIDIHCLDRFGLGSKIHGEGGNDVLGWWSTMIEGNDRHQFVILLKFVSLSIGELSFGHLQPSPAEEEGFSGAGDAGLAVVDHQDVMQIISRQFFSIGRG